MLKTNLAGPYRLTVDGIDLVVRNRSAGVFALGRLDRDGNFRLSRVGRSDDDLHETLRNLIASGPLFKFAYARDAEEAFLRECELFHSFRPQGNFFHPTRPAGSRIICRLCGSESR